MRAMVLEAPGRALALRELAEPEPGPDEILLEVAACGVCRTDLHVLRGELAEPRLPLVLGHQIVGRVVRAGSRVSRFAPGDRVGVPWLGRSCGACDACRAGRENLCDGALYTGYQLPGGMAERCVAAADYCFAIPASYGDLEAAPLLCAGLIGWRALRFAGDARRLGFYGFGASAHLLLQVARRQGREVFAFTRAGDAAAQDFARALGAAWAGDAERTPPAPLDAAIVFAPVGALVPAALGAVRKGGVVVCAGIHMSDIPSFPYALLWGERAVRSVANLTRRDGEEFFAETQREPVRSHVHVYALEDAQRALEDLEAGRFQGAAVIAIDVGPLTAEGDRRPAP
jgi:propanol-preferring alcohol dehydrogenase